MNEAIEVEQSAVARDKTTYDHPKTSFSLYIIRSSRENLHPFRFHNGATMRSVQVAASSITIHLLSFPFRVIVESRPVVHELGKRGGIGRGVCVCATSIVVDSHSKTICSACKRERKEEKKTQRSTYILNGIHFYLKRTR